MNQNSERQLFVTDASHVPLTRPKKAKKKGVLSKGVVKHLKVAVKMMKRGQYTKTKPKERHLPTHCRRFKDYDRDDDDAAAISIPVTITVTV